MDKLTGSALIFVCGWPFSGKTLLAEHLRDNLHVHHVDIDELRWLAIGKPYPHPNESPELMKRDGQEMGGAYRFTFNVIDWHLETGRPLIATATLSSKPHGQEKLRAVYEKYPDARVRIMQCVPENDTTEAVAKMMANRKFGGGGYKGAVNSPERYFEVKGRYNPIELPHIVIPTWGSGWTVVDEVRLATDYILS